MNESKGERIKKSIIIIFVFFFFTLFRAELAVTITWIYTLSLARLPKIPEATLTRTENTTTTVGTYYPRTRIERGKIILVPRSLKIIPDFRPAAADD